MLIHTFSLHEERTTLSPRVCLVESTGVSRKKTHSWTEFRPSDLRRPCSASRLMCFSVSGKIPPLRRVPCGCGLGGRHSNVFVTQERGNCKRFLHNCASVPLPGGSWASQASSVRPLWPCGESARGAGAQRGGSWRNCVTAANGILMLCYF